MTYFHKGKRGVLLSNREDYLFWKLAQILITDKGYSLMHISEDHNELWLEDTANKHAQVIRLLRNDLDWGKKLQRDVHHTAVQAENIRKHLMKRQLNVLNIYVSMHLPVDEFESYIQRPIQVNKKTLLHSAIIDQENVNTGITYLEKLLNDEIIIHLNDEYEDQDVAELKSAVITNVVSKTKQEQQFFDNGKPFFTYVFLAIQIAMFILLEMTGGSNNQENLIRYGAKFNPLILEGEWWRFITPIFLHIGFLHILMNSLALFYLGPTVEKIFGRIRFVWIYLFRDLLEY